ncbi:vacuolar-sorting protein BRO1-like [Typha angustifolia]|uniref:vacuolar-sorting protein BRO1-like n=1 Tax=Typha angustifolia TaxID=59011 RepID=UPI003C308922
MAESMLLIPEKEPIPIDLYSPLRYHIAVTFSDRVADSSSDDIAALDDMRAALENPLTPSSSAYASSSSSLESRRGLLLAYYRALALIDLHFPISTSIPFTWHDAFKPHRKCSHPSIRLEMAAVLFNLGAVHSRIAIEADRAEEAGLKAACNAFQCAAGVFELLKETGSVEGATVDLTAECAVMLGKLMLAQAQECYFEKVVGDGKPPGLCSKVARQVGLYYEEVSAALSTEPLKGNLKKSWVSHVQLKAAQFYAEACYYHALELHIKEIIPEEIVWLRTGIDVLANAKMTAKSVTAAVLDAISILESKLRRNLERAEMENDRVYLMRIPPLSSLAPLSAAASLVKPTSMAEVLDPSNERLFANLILLKYTKMDKVKAKEMDVSDSVQELGGETGTTWDVYKEEEEEQEEEEEKKMALQLRRGSSSSMVDELRQLRAVKRKNEMLLAKLEELRWVRRQSLATWTIISPNVRLMILLGLLVLLIAIILWYVWHR